MKISCQDISFCLKKHNFGFLDNEDTFNLTVNAIAEIYNGSKTLIKMPKKLISVFDETAHYTLSKKTAKKIVYDILCQTQLSQLVNELTDCDVLKDKIYVDRDNFIITLKVNDDFTVKSYLTKQKTYINDKFYSVIEDQDLLETYCGFVIDL